MTTICKPLPDTHTHTGFYFTPNFEWLFRILLISSGRVSQLCIWPPKDRHSFPLCQESCAATVVKKLQIWCGKTAGTETNEADCVWQSGSCPRSSNTLSWLVIYSWLQLVLASQLGSRCLSCLCLFEARACIHSATSISTPQKFRLFACCTFLLSDRLSSSACHCVYG